MAHVTADRVRDTTTTTGTGAVTVSGTAPSTYRTFSAVMATNDTCYYCVSHQTANEWEVGLATYSGTNQLTRTQVFKSSNSNAAVNFSAGTKDIAIVLPADKTNLREMLFADRTYYVRTDGNDNNTGLTNTSGGAFATIQKAYDTITGTVDLNGYTATIKLGNTGTYTTSFYGNNPIIGGNIYIQGDTATPSNTHISVTNGDAIVLFGVGSLCVEYVKISTTTSGSCVWAGGPSSAIYITNTVEFGSCAGVHAYASAGGTVSCQVNYTISGGAAAHMAAEYHGFVDMSFQTVTLTGTPAFSVAYASASNLGAIRGQGCTFSGSATGVRYVAYSNSIIITNGGGSTYFPGNSAGTAGGSNVGIYA